MYRYRKPYKKHESKYLNEAKFLRDLLNKKVYIETITGERYIDSILISYDRNWYFVQVPEENNRIHAIRKSSIVCITLSLKP